jgi:glycosyltransferase involved in cell wall biosynthesis
MRFHILGLAHLPTNRTYESCAYSMKIIRLCQMIKDKGNYVYFYGGEGSQVACDEFIPVLSEAERTAVYGNYDWKSTFFKHDPKDAAHAIFNMNAIKAINARKQKDDILCVTMGNYQKPITDAVQLALTCESGIGYEGIYTGYRVFESYAWMHHLYGLISCKDGNFFDAVIPNSYTPSEFTFSDKKDDYFLYIGRLIWRKGIQIAIDTVKRLGKKLVIAGQGDLKEFKTKGANLEVIGTVTGEDKKRLYANAIATFVPTIYIGPFEGVAVESMMSGTPIITTDWGVFTETNQHNKTGYRCRLLREFVVAAKKCLDGKIDYKTCRDWAVSNYSTEVVKEQYQDFFERISTLMGEGWYAK